MIVQILLLRHSCHTPQYFDIFGARSFSNCITLFIYRCNISQCQMQWMWAASKYDSCATKYDCSLINIWFSLHSVLKRPLSDKKCRSSVFSISISNSSSGFLGSGRFIRLWLDKGFDSTFCQLVSTSNLEEVFKIEYLAVSKFFFLISASMFSMCVRLGKTSLHAKYQIYRTIWSFTL